jgi:hypothetical protein
MILPVLAVVLVLAVVVAAYLMLKRRTDAVAGKADRLESPQTETLTYTLPPGQDPAVVLAALERDGFTALSPVTGGRPQVIVECPNGRERNREPVRRALEGAGTTGFEGEPLDTHGVQFDDESDEG